MKQTISIRIGEDCKRQLDEAAARLGHTRSSLIQWVCERWLRRNRGGLYGIIKRREGKDG